ncbi:GntR family transcriptional regulator [Microterricola pindariensis]|uniref:HTH gntR-type domain-containing protein n=1 Tax=Microterricola pindariensis TaxID=478010 RepID=A0ABX5AWT8_9MICO|nr:GntR family transcriptional regulator [Microterricola pindariensis]PPL19357.1 hypothetical protein GY24_06595 [Microterricola pindariensis]
MSEISMGALGLPSEQIAGQLRARILSGGIAAGERVPPVRQLARDLGVAAGTVQKAYKQLESEGLLVSRSGGGTRVSAAITAPPVEVLKAARSLAELASGRGLSLDEALAAVRASWPAD